MKNRDNDKVYKLVLTALMAALCYVAFTFLKIPIPTPGGDTTALHIGNAFCVLQPCFSAAVTAVWQVPWA